MALNSCTAHKRPWNRNKKVDKLSVISSFETEYFSVQFNSINFHGARITVHASRVTTGHDNAFFLIFSNRSKNIFFETGEPGDHFVDFGKFGFSGFFDEEVNVSLVSIRPHRVLDERPCRIRRLPHAAFYQDLHPDHHQSYFFKAFRPDLVSYGKVGDRYSTNGIFVLSADVDQARLPDEIRKIEGVALDRLRHSQALLLIDQSHEGNPFSSDFMYEMHSELKRVGIREDLVFFLNHTHGYADLYSKWFQDSEFSSRINIFYSNWYSDGYFLKQKDFFDSFGGIDAYVQDQRFRAFSDIVRPKRFMSLNYTPRGHRVMLMLELLQRGYLNAGYVSFGGTKNADQYKSNFYESDGVGFLRSMGRADLIEHLPVLDEMGAWTLDQSFQAGVFGEAIRMSATSPDKHFENSYFSIVTESEFFSSDFMRVTEKSFKPIMRMHPSIFIGNYNTLGLLEDLGYKRFDGFFDNGYDLMTDAPARFAAAMQEIARLMEMSSEELASIYRRSWDVLEENIYNGHDYILSGLRRHNSTLLNAMIGKLSSL